MIYVEKKLNKTFEWGCGSSSSIFLSVKTYIFLPSVKFITKTKLMNNFDLLSRQRTYISPQIKTQMEE